MKVKAVLRFYFTAEETIGRLDGLINKKALSVNWERSAEQCAEEVARLVEKKGELCALVRAVDKIMQKFGGEETEALRRYALCKGEKKFTDDERRQNHRLAVAFARRVNRAADSWRERLKAAAEFMFFT